MVPLAGFEVITEDENAAGGIVLFGEPVDVALDSLTNPRRTNPVDSCRAYDEVAVKHENLLSPGEVQEIIARFVSRYVSLPARLARAAS
jgi:hypothetical protein